MNTPISQHDANVFYLSHEHHLKGMLFPGSVRFFKLEYLRIYTLLCMYF